MSESTEVFSAMGDLRKAKRAAFGVACPVCQKERPRANPSILLPRKRSSKV